MKRRIDDIVLALVFLTRLPLGWLLPAQVIPLSRAVWAFPLAGAVVGAIAALPMLVGGPPLLSAALAVGLSIWLTGALHEDGLADLADGMGGADRQRRLEIMRDSRIGSYGAMALILSTMLRVAALAALPGTTGLMALVAAATGARAAIVVAMAVLPPARTDGLGRQAATAGTGAGTLAMAGLLAAMALAPLQSAALMALIAGLIAAGLVIRIARNRLGGQTGDVLGAVSVTTETAILAALAMLIGTAG